MLNASDAFFSVLRPADDHGWARTLAALATALKQAATPAFKEYQTQARG